MRKYADQQLTRAAGRVWTEGRANSLDWQIATPLGTFGTTGRATWHTDSGEWSVELRRSKKGHHMFLAVFEGGYLSRPL